MMINEYILKDDTNNMSANVIDTIVDQLDKKSAPGEPKRLNIDCSDPNCWVIAENTTTNSISVNYDDWKQLKKEADDILNYKNSKEFYRDVLKVGYEFCKGCKDSCELCVMRDFLNMINRRCGSRFDYSFEKYIELNEL